MAIHSSILVWKIPWTEERGGLQSVGSQRVGHDFANNTHTPPAPAQIWFSSYYFNFFSPYLAALGPSCGTWYHLVVAYRMSSGGMWDLVP